jgi:integrase/recombinase XerC
MFQSQLGSFIRFLKYEKRYSPHTVLAYETDLTQFQEFLDHTYEVGDIKNVTHYHIRTWLADAVAGHGAARTVNRKMSRLNSFFKYLQTNGDVPKNPLKKLHSRRLPERLPIHLKIKEAGYLLDGVPFADDFGGMTDRLICELLYATGMRRSELVQLKERDVEWAMRQIRVLGKGNKERLIPVSGFVLDAIRKYLDAKSKLPRHDDTFLLNTETGIPLYPMYVYRVVTGALGNATTLQKKSPHVLRHTFATHLLNEGANIQAIKELLGHSSLAATQIYTHNDISKLKAIHQLNHPLG